MLNNEMTELEIPFGLLWYIINQRMQNLFNDICFKTEMEENKVKEQFKKAIDYLIYIK